MEMKQLEHEVGWVLPFRVLLLHMWMFRAGETSPEDLKTV